jgi:SAM-dependent methyltransferase
VERLALMSGRIPVPVLDALFGMMKARALMAGVRLGVFDALAGAPLGARDLAERRNLDPDALDLLLRTLVHCDYLVARDGTYALSSLGRRTMTEGGAMDLRGFVRWNYAHWEFAEHLDDLVRTGRGVNFHETLKDPSAWADYQQAMLELARLDAPTLARHVKVPQGATRLLDVAGSHGLLGAAICRRHPPMRSTVVDLPVAVEHATKLARAEGIDDVVEHRAGNLIVDELGDGYDVALAANILHHFQPDQIADILARIRRAVREGGTIAIWDLERPLPGSPPSEADAVALFFRLASTAGVYHGTEYARWLAAAGFSKTQVLRPLTSPGTVLVTGY